MEASLRVVVTIAIIVFSIVYLGIYRSSLIKNLLHASLKYLRGDNSSTIARLGMASQRSAENNFGYGEIRVSKLLVHPIKSCRGTSIEHSRYTPEGLEYDRQWCIIDATAHKVITARDEAKMVLITPYVERDSDSPCGGVLRVTFPAGQQPGVDTFSVPLRPTAELLDTWSRLDAVSMWGLILEGYICENASPNSGSPPTSSPSDILSSYLGRPVLLVYKSPYGRPRPCETTPLRPDLTATAVYQDSYPLLVLSEEGVELIDKEVKSYTEGGDPGRVGVIKGISDDWKKERVEIERFRPNIIIRGAGPFAEDSWEEIRIVSSDTVTAPEILLVSRCARCLLPNVSPKTGIRDPAVPFKVLMKCRNGATAEDKSNTFVGCNGVPRGEGTVRVGDMVEVRRVLQAH